jgi:hypothetical protein
MDAIVESGIEVHGRTSPVRELMGGDTALLSLAFGHACPSSNHHCHICTKHKMDIALRKRVYRLKGMEVPFTKKAAVSNKIGYVSSAKFGLVELYIFAGCLLVVIERMQEAPTDYASAR